LICSAVRRCSPISTRRVVNARTSAAWSRPVINALVIASLRRPAMVRTKESNISRADRTDAQPWGSAATRTTGASNGCSTPAVATAAEVDTTADTRSPVSATMRPIRCGPSEPPGRPAR
jgi:hypothetical protein